MRICLISREYPPETGWGGIGTFTYHLANGLVKSEHDVHVVSLEGPRGITSPKNDSGPTVHRVHAEQVADKEGLFNFCLPVTRPMLDETTALWKLFLKLHEETPFDIVECPEHFAEGLFPALVRVAPLVVRLHTPHSKLVKEKFHNFEATFDHRILTGLERVAMLAADTLISPSNDLAEYVANDLNMPVGRIHIVRNPVDTERFTPEGEKAFDNQRGATVMFVGRLEARKGIHHLIQAVPKILKECPSTRFVLVGSDTKTGANNSSVADELKSVLTEHDCLDSVRFVSHVLLHEMPDYYRAADVCVLPSLYDNAPMTVIEAMSSGRPLVVSSAGGAKEYIQDNKSGLVVPPGDADALADAIIRLVKDESLRKSFGTSARKRALSHFSIKKTVDDTIKIYEKTTTAFAKRNQPALYTGKPAHLQNDLHDLVESFEKRLYEMMFTYSWRFRLKHWQNKAKEIFARKD
jgi:glycosyltransferase involved in cell wall biosynthesis